MGWGESDFVTTSRRGPASSMCFGDGRNEPGVLEFGQVVLEGWKAPGLTLSEVGSLWGHFGSKRPVWTH